MPEELEAFHNKSYDFSIPANINDFNKPRNQKTVQQTKGPNVISDSEKLPKEFINLQINSNNDEKEVIQQKMKRQNIGDIDDDDEMYNNPNLHSEEQDELEIPDDGF
ncbi:unnamed protein product [Rhizophagus irregularis]|nr:unnamed protein product [Rhizophagus irregularis]